MSYITRWKQFWCTHAVFIEDIKFREKEGSGVQAPCNKCGKILIAEYGLILPATLGRRPK